MGYQGPLNNYPDANIKIIIIIRSPGDISGHMVLEFFITPTIH